MMFDYSARREARSKHWQMNVERSRKRFSARSLCFHFFVDATIEDKFLFRRFFAERALALSTFCEGFKKSSVSALWRTRIAP
jgi:hypothetical protein